MRSSGRYIQVVCWMISLFFLTVIMTRCVEPFEPEVPEYEQTLVVDGLLTDGDAPSRVVLSTSFGFDENVPSFVSGALVIIEDDMGGSTTLEEVETGIYETDPAVYKGEVGASYRLLVSTPEGQRYESSWEFLQASPPIEKLDYEFIDIEQNDPSERPVRGAQITLDTRDGENGATYFSWDYEEIYEFELPHAPRIRVEFGSPPGRGSDFIFDIPNEEYEGLRCWKTEKSNQLLIASTENLSERVIQDFKINFIDNSTPRLFIRYSILVNQYAISKEYYDNLRKIFEVNQTTGSLFDPIPNEIFGNIINVTSEGSPVLGYFGVAGVSQKRIFINREDAPERFGAARGPSCELETIPLNFRTLFDRVERGPFVLQDYARDLLFGNPVGYILTLPVCASCAESDATNKRPDFW